MSSKRRPKKQVTPSRARSSSTGQRPPAQARRPPAQARHATARVAASRRRRMRNVAAGILGVGVLAGAITLAVVGHGSSAGSNTNPQAFVLPRLGSSGKVSLASFRGRPVVVNFFASWCTECASELPVFATDAQTLRGRIAFVEVNTLETGNGLGFAQQFNLPTSGAAVASDVGGSQGSGLYQALGGTGSMPMTAFYSSQGTVLTTHVGAYNATTLAGELQQLYGVTVPG